MGRLGLPLSVRTVAASDLDVLLDSLLVDEHLDEGASAQDLRVLFYAMSWWFSISPRNLPLAKQSLGGALKLDGSFSRDPVTFEELILLCHDLLI